MTVLMEVMTEKIVMDTATKDLFLQKVSVNKILKRTHSNDTSTWESFPKEFTGFIIGRRCLQTGVRHAGYGGSWELSYSDSEPPYFRETAPRTPCVLVVVDMRKKVEYVPMDGFELINDNE